MSNATTANAVNKLNKYLSTGTPMITVKADDRVYVYAGASWPEVVSKIVAGHLDASVELYKGCWPDPEQRVKSFDFLKALPGRLNVDTTHVTVALDMVTRRFETCTQFSSKVAAIEATKFMPQCTGVVSIRIWSVKYYQRKVLAMLIKDVQHEL